MPFKSELGGCCVLLSRSRGSSLTIFLLSDIEFIEYTLSPGATTTERTSSFLHRLMSDDMIFYFPLLTV